MRRTVDCLLHTHRRWGKQLQGGAIYNEGVMDFNAGSVFEGNVAVGSGDGGRGGAIFNANGGVIT